MRGASILGDWLLVVAALSAHAHLLSWRALSADGHVVPGKIHFTLGR
jgi:methionine-rich copper-binding protein CopC